MKKLLSTAKTVIVLGAIGLASVGCHKATTTVPADTAVVTPAPMTTTAATVTTPSSTPDTSAANGAGTGGTAMGSSKNAGATDSAMGSATAGNSMNSAHPAVRNNTGETQGTTPNTSLPVSDGSR